MDISAIMQMALCKRGSIYDVEPDADLTMEFDCLNSAFKDKITKINGLTADYNEIIDVIYRIRDDFAAKCYKDGFMFGIEMGLEIAERHNRANKTESK